MYVEKEYETDYLHFLVFITFDDFTGIGCENSFCLLCSINKKLGRGCEYLCKIMQDEKFLLVGNK